MHVIGDVKDKVCLLVDDIIDSGGTLCNAAGALKENGAKEAHAYVVHGVLSGQAVERIEKSSLKSLVLTNSIVATDIVKTSKKIEQLTIAPLIGEAIRCITEEKSISALFR